MPITRSAIKKLRRDKKLEKERAVFEKKLDDTIKKAMSAGSKTKKGKSEAVIKVAISQIDKAAKNNIFHKNKASRLKSKLSKLGKNTEASEKKATPKKSTTAKGDKTTKAKKS